MTNPETTIRIARPSEFPEIAKLRWALKTADGQIAVQESYEIFEAKFVAAENARPSGEATHWIARERDAAIAVMTVIRVSKVHAPDREPAEWGYLTNCYVAPEHRGSGVGRRMLSQVQAWAKINGLELLIVWPSDAAYDFYRQAGFDRPEDPLVWVAD